MFIEAKMMNFKYDTVLVQPMDTMFMTPIFKLINSILL